MEFPVAPLPGPNGTLNWFCLPDYDGDIIFGALLDASKGGWQRHGSKQFLDCQKSKADNGEHKKPLLYESAHAHRLPALQEPD